MVSKAHKYYAVYYDGDCGLCLATVETLGRFESRHAIKWVAYRESDTLPPGISWSDLGRSVYVHSAHDDAVYEGFYAVRILLSEFRHLQPLAAFLSAPGVDRLGVAVYRWVARNRHRLSGCRLQAGV
jgi:predicted DCC family thiol-disulfide oxidoreductase YuxK